jgi:H+/Cl- antiporter ClcA
VTTTPEGTPGAAPDPAAILRSRNFIGVLVIAAVIGVIVSFAGWCFLELIHQIQLFVYRDLAPDLGFSSTPSWWGIPVLAIAGVVAAFAIVKLPGNGGHVPAEGLQVGQTAPNVVPGVTLAAIASLGLGVVLGPEAPLIAIGAGLAVFTVQLAKRDAPPQLLLIIGAAGSFAAISVIFGSPIVAAILVIEASGLGGAMLPLILIPGLVAAGIGSLIFVGMANWTGLNNSAYSLGALQLPHFSGVTWENLAWSVALALAGAVLAEIFRRFGLAGARHAHRRPWLLIPLAGVFVGVLALVFASATTHGAQQVLFSGQEALPGLVSNASTWSLGALALVILLKGSAWSASLATFRGGPTFPAIFLGAAGGIAASHLPGMSLDVGVAVGMAVMVVSFLKLPLSAVVIATSLTTEAGLGVGPLIIVGTVVAYLATLALEGRLTVGGVSRPSDPTG